MPHSRLDGLLTHLRSKWQSQNLEPGFTAPGGSVVKNPPANAGLHPWVRKIPWRRKQQPSLVFLPGKCNGQRSLAGCGSWGLKRVRDNWTTKQKQPGMCQRLTAGQITEYGRKGVEVV